MSKRPLTPEEIGRIQEVASARTLYAVLSLSVGATKETVESAYRAYVREWHPDRFYSRDTGEHKATIEQNFVNATRAYETLRDERRRRDYETELGATGQLPKSKPKAPEKPVEPEIPGYEISFGKNPAEAPKVEPAKPKVEAPKPPPSPTNAAVQRLRAQLAEQNNKAMSYYQSAKADFDAGHYVKAEGSLYLALKIAPQNAEIQALYQKASEKAKQARAETLIHQAEQAEQYGRTKEALAYYQRACECDPADGKAWFLLAKVRKSLGEEDSPKELLVLYKKAVMKSPKVLEYRLAAAEGYLTLGMTANALREATAAVEIDPKSEAAKGLLKRAKQA